MSPHRFLPRPRRLGIVIASGVLGGVALAAVVHAQAGPKAPASVLGSQVVNSTNGNGNDQAAKSFVVSGDVGGLAPGVTRTLSLKLSNPNNSDISVQSLTVVVGTGSSGCAGTNIRVGAFPGPVMLPRNGTAQVSVPITMLGSAPGACQGATFPLTYGGSAVKA